MDTMLYFTLLILAQGIAVEAKDHYGTEYYLAMMSGFPNYLEPDIVIDIASRSEGVAYLHIPSIQEHRNITLMKGITHLNIPKNISRRGTFKENRGIHIHASVPVSVYVTCQTRDTMDMYLALPVSSLGHLYVAASYEPHHRPSSYVLILGVYNNTNVTIVHPNKTVFNQELNSFDVYQLESTSDLTSTKVISDRDIVVISGSPNTWMQHLTEHYDIILEEMIPYEFWTDTFIVPEIYPGLKYSIRVLTTEAVHLCFQNYTSKLCKSVEANDVIDFLFENSSVSVLTNTSVSLVQYGYTLTQYGNTFTSVVPGLQNYMNLYSFVAPNTTGADHYISLFVQTSELNGLLLDDAPLIVIKQDTAPEPLSNYSILYIHLNTGYHELKHRTPNVRFGAMLYGLQNYVGYGFPLGLQTPENQSRSVERRQTCYHCDDMSSLEVCDTVKLCDNNQMCYAEKYLSRTGTYYKSGCIEKETCQKFNITHGGVTCLECCSDDFCNNKGCEFPDRDRRGPMCYDCQHVLNDPNDCHKVTMCSSKECSPMRRTVPTFGNKVKRSAPVCSSCCVDDFCNRNCTSVMTGDSGPVIVG